MHRFEERFRDEWDPNSWKDVTVLVGVSGGPDSVALLRTMLATRLPGEGRIVVGHFDHGLRGRASAADADFVVSTCRHLGVPCETGRAEPQPGGPGRPDRAEEAARTARYRFLRSSAEELGARYLVTGHTADDQAETILHHILRGTGLRGLGGMRRSRAIGSGVSLIRPLLAFRREEVLAYLQAIGQSYRDDDSNRDTTFTRNWLRHELLPLVAARSNPAVVDALVRLGRTAREAQAALAPVVAELEEEAVGGEPNGAVVIDCDVLARHSPHLIRELFVAVWERREWPQQAMTFAKWDELAEMAAGTRQGKRIGQRVLPGGIVARREGRSLHLLPPTKGPRPA